MCVALRKDHRMRAPHLVMATVTSGHVDNYGNAMAEYNLIEGDTLGISSSVTAYISLAGLTGTADAHITVMNFGKVNLTGQVFVKDFNYVDWLFSDPTDHYGLRFTGTDRPFNIQGSFSNNWVHGIEFKNTTDWFLFTANNRRYDGTLSSTYHDNTFDSLYVHNGVNGWWPGNPSDSLDFWVHTKFHDIIIDTLQETSVIHANDFFDLQVYNFKFLHLSRTDTLDKGVIDITGSLKMYNGYINDYNGSAVRSHAISLVSDKTQSEDTTLIYNCVFVDAGKYGGIQINTLYGDTVPSFIRPGSIIVAFNTGFKFRDLSYWTDVPVGGGGVLIDFYHCRGKTCLIYGNAYCYMHYDHGQNLAVNYLIHNGAGDTPFPDTVYNIRVLNPATTFSDTVLMIPVNPSVLTNAAPALDYLSSSFNGVFRMPGQLTFAGAYNFYVQLIGPRQDKKRNRIVIHKP